MKIPLIYFKFIKSHTFSITYYFFQFYLLENIHYFHTDKELLNSIKIANAFPRRKTWMLNKHVTSFENTKFVMKINLQHQGHPICSYVLILAPVSQVCPGMYGI